LISNLETAMSLFNQYIERYRREEEEYSLEEFLDICKKDRIAYASAAERMLMAIGEPEMVDTRQDARLSRLFSNKIDQDLPGVQGVLRHGRDHRADRFLLPPRRAGLEEKKQILYLLGPVGGGKSSLAEKLKQPDGERRRSTRSRARR
jgi:serine protein kinase